jgi:3-oxoacyl-[acyl-carrier protein] reductase
VIDLSGRSALVTGGSRGIGKAIALRLATQGADVAFSYKGNASAAAATAAEVEGLGRRALAVQADVTDPEAADGVVKAVLDAFGKVDILVNNAGITRDDLIMRMSAEAWREVLETNLFGAFWMTKAVTRPMLKARGGRIINITSVSGQAGQTGQANYSAAKAGLIGLTKATARELASRGITANAVAPGFVLT